VTIAVSVSVAMKNVAIETNINTVTVIETAIDLFYC